MMKMAKGRASGRVRMSSSPEPGDGPAEQAQHHGHPSSQPSMAASACRPPPPKSVRVNMTISDGRTGRDHGVPVWALW